MTRKYGYVLAVIIAVAAILAGCSANTDMGTTTAPKQTAGPVDLYLFSASGQNMEWFDRTYGKYLYEKFPNITFHVKFSTDTKIQEHLATNAPLDIIFGAYTNFHVSILDMNLQNDISDLIKSNKFDLNKYDPEVIALQRQMANGGIYGLPAFIGTSGLYYNKDIFDRFAVTYPKDNITWDELYDLAVKLTRSDNGTQYYGFANDNNTYLQVNQYSLDLIDPKTFKANFTSDGWKKIAQTLTRFMTIPGYDIAQATVAAFNTKGTVAMATNYTGCCGFTPGDTVTNWGVVRIPDFPELKNVGPQVFPNYWYMSSISKNRQAAFEVMAYVASEEFQASLNSRGLATALKDTKLHEKYGQDLPKYNGQNVKALFPNPRAKMSVITPYQIIAATSLNAALTNIAKGKDVNTALREATEDADIKIATTRQSEKK